MYSCNYNHILIIIILFIGGRNILANSEKDSSKANTPYFLQVKEAQKKISRRLNSFDASDMNNIVIFVTFADAIDFDEPTSYYLDLFNDHPNSVKSYYKTISNDQLIIENHIFPIQDQAQIVGYQLAFNRLYYLENFNELYNEVFTFLNQAVPENLDLDKNNDGEVDCITIIQQGNRTASMTPFWPRLALDATGIINNIEVTKAITVRDEKLDPDLIAHEMGHVLGQYDLYNPEFGNTFIPIGDWDIMANHNAFAGMSAYTLWLLGFIDAIPEITEPGTYTLNELYSSNKSIAFRIASGRPGEYFILEYRKQESGNYFDSNLPGSGLLIYKFGGDNSYKYYLHRLGRIDNEITNGDLSKAFFSLESGRTNFDANSSTMPILSDGSLADFNISKVGSASGQSITFRYDRITCPIFTDDKLFFNTGVSVPNHVSARSLAEFDGFFNYHQGDEKVITSDKVIKWGPGFSAFEGSKISARISSCEESHPMPPMVRSLYSPNNTIYENEEVMSTFTIFPNPSNGEINININNIDLSNSQLSITDINGNFILKTSLEKKNMSLDLSYYDDGLYIISVIHDQGTLTDLIEVVH